MVMNVSQGTCCPCGAPATHQIWETKLGVCAAHAVAWLGSPEKLACTQSADGTVGGADWKPGDAAGDEMIRASVDHFVARIRKERRGIAPILGRALRDVWTVIVDAYQEWRFGRRS